VVLSFWGVPKNDILQGMEFEIVGTLSLIDSSCYLLHSLGNDLLPVMALVAGRAFDPEIA
jgi:hypothetical protein